MCVCVCVCSCVCVFVCVYVCTAVHAYLPTENLSHTLAENSSTSRDRINVASRITSSKLWI